MGKEETREGQHALAEVHINMDHIGFKIMVSLKMLIKTSDIICMESKSFIYACLHENILISR
jgi:hypothetical protein